MHRIIRSEGIAVIGIVGAATTLNARAQTARETVFVMANAAKRNEVITYRQSISPDDEFLSVTERVPNNIDTFRITPNVAAL